MKAESKRDSYFHIKASKLSFLCLILSYLCFYVSVLNLVVANDSLKILFFILKNVFLIFGVIITLCRGGNRGVLILSFVSAILGLATLDKITIEISLALLFLTIFKKEKLVDSVRLYFDKLACISLVFFASIVLLSLVGIIDSRVYNNPLAVGSELEFIAENKESLGFWNPNVASAIIASVVLMSFITQNNKLFFSSVIVYAFTFPLLLTKVFFPIIVSTILLRIFYHLKYAHLIRLGAVCSIFVSASTIALAFFLVFPSILRDLVGNQYYDLLDVASSLRLTIAERATLGLNLNELLFGMWWPKNYIDSGIANLAFSIGLFPAIIIFCFYLHVMFKNLQARNYKVVYFLMFFSVINFFESLLYYNSLLFVFCVYTFISSNKNAGLAHLNKVCHENLQKYNTLQKA